MKLSTRILLPLVLTATAGVTMAQEVAFPAPQFESTVSRAEVAADARAARDANLIVNGEVLPVQKALSIGKSRSEVRAEAIEANRLGLLAPSEEVQFPTVAEAEQIRLAGHQAMQVSMQ